MRRLLSYGLCLLLLAACAREQAIAEWEGPVIELRLSCEESAVSKAGADGTEDGVNAYRENLIEWVDFYFYPGDTPSGNATYHIRKENLSVRNRETFRLELTTNQVNYLIFPVQSETTTATVLVLANVPTATLDADDDTSLEHLQSLVLSSDFVSPANHRQSRFMMSGTLPLTLAGRTQKVVSQGLVELSRYASKLTVGIKLNETVEIDTNRTEEDSDVHIFEVWRPCVEEMQIYLEGGVSNVALSGLPAGTAGGAPTPSYFSYRSNPMLFFENTGTQANPVYSQIFDKNGDYYTTFPMYTYPHHWTEGVANEEAVDNEPFLKLILPWERQADPDHGIRASKRPFYYKILIPKDRRGGSFEDSFQRNNWYHYDIEVGMLGADTEDAAVDVDPINFYIYYWQDKNIVVKHASIGNARYLSVEKEYKVEDEDDPTKELKFYELDNLNTLDVRYTSSNPVEYTVLSVTRPYFGSTAPTAQNPEPRVLGGILRESDGDRSTWPGKLYPAGQLYLEYAYDTDESGQVSTKGWFQDTGSAIVFTHTLNNNYATADFDSTPYTIFLMLRHADGGTGDDYAKTVKIVQNPGMYIVAELNSDPQLPGPPGGDDSQENTENKGRAVWVNYAHNGYVFVDGERRMRHLTGRNDDGMYGTLARRLNPSWKNDVNAAGTIRQKLEWLQWRTVNFTGGSRNRYKITVTVLPASQTVNKTTFDYVIGDPRTLEPETWNNGRETAAPAKRQTSAPYDYYEFYDYYNYWDKNGDGTPEDDDAYEIEFQEAPPIGGGAPRKLTWYYPADESDRTRNMLAPELRVASRFGGLEFYTGVTFQSAKFKCATYQEDGYPAGRWRLPTMAEIVFISSLTTQPDFVKLFSSGSKYWSANGAIIPSSGPQNKLDFALVRCVYDSWYWDQMDESIQRLPEGDRDRYVFGDQPR